MKDTWPAYFKREAALEQLAREAGLAEPRQLAARLNEQLLHPLPLTTRARLLAEVITRRLQNKEHTS